MIKRQTFFAEIRASLFGKSAKAKELDAWADALFTAPTLEDVIK